MLSISRMGLTVRFLVALVFLGFGLGFAGRYATDVARVASEAGTSETSILPPGPAPRLLYTASSYDPASNREALRSANSATSVGQPEPVLRAGPELVRSSQTPLFSQQSPAAARAVKEGTMTRQLLVELRRLGCYEGSASETWTPGAQAAMRRALFVSNAQLPVERVDQSLLALAQSLSDNVCRCADDTSAKSCGGIATVRPVQGAATAASTSSATRKVASARAAGSGASNAVQSIGGAWSVAVVPSQSPAGANARKEIGAVASVERTANALDAVGPEPITAPRSSPELPGRMALSGPAAEPPPRRAAPVTGQAPPRLSHPVARAESRSNQRSVNAAPVRGHRAADNMFRHPLGF